MNRRSFFSKLAVGIAAVPVVALAGKPASRPGVRLVPIDLPQNDKITSMIIYQDRLFLACASSVYTVPLSELRP